MLGSWEVNVSTSGMPQKVASAFTEATEYLLGANYEFIAYLGSQVVNGTNHAILAKQTVLAGKDTENVVVFILNEKGDTFTTVSIERVVESGAELGGITVNVQTEIPEDAQAAFDSTLEGIVGSDFKPFALLGTQVVKGTNYIFAAELTPVTKDPVKKVAIVVVNSLTGEVGITDILTAKADSLALGYAFTWLKRQNSTLGAPLS